MKATIPRPRMAPLNLARHLTNLNSGRSLPPSVEVPEA